MGAKERWFVAITLFYIAYMVFPFVKSVTHIPEWFVCMAVSIFLLIPFFSYLRQRFLFWLFLYFLVLLLYSIFGHPFHINGLGDSSPLFRRLTIEIAWILPSLLICAIVIGLRNPSVYRQIALGSIIILSISIVILLPSLISYGRILRENLSMIDNGEQELAANLPGYTLMSCYSFFMPVLLYGFRCRPGLLKFLYGLIIVLFVYAIIKTEITTSFIAVVLVFCSALIYRNEDVEHMKSVIAVLFMLVLIWFLYETGVILILAEKLIELYQGTAAQSKFIEFRDFVLGDEDEGNVSLRKYLRDMSLQCFYMNPLIGSDGVGGHSSLLDRLGSMGLIGFIPFVAMLISNVKIWSKQMPDRAALYYYFIGVFIVFMFLYMKGLFGAEGMLFFTVIIPVSVIGIGASSSTT